MKKTILILVLALLFSCKKVQKIDSKPNVQSNKIVIVPEKEQVQTPDKPTADALVSETNETQKSILGNWVLENSDGIGWSDITVNEDNTLVFSQGPCQGTLKYSLVKNEYQLVFDSSDCKIDIGDSSKCEGKKIGTCYLNSDDKLVLEINTNNLLCGEMTTGKYILNKADY